MTDALETARAAIFAALDHCPMCGAPVRVRQSSGAMTTVEFTCDTELYRARGKSACATTPCPGPTEIALRYHDAEAQARAAAAPKAKEGGE